MAVTTLSGVPSPFRAGDTVRFRHSNSSYPSSEWTAKLSLRGRVSQLTVSATVDGDRADGFLVTLTAAQTRALLPGAYSAGYVYTETSSGEIESSDVFSVQVLPNLADTTIGPRRAAYDAALTALQNFGADGIASFNINGQQITYTSLKDLQAYVDRLHIAAIEEDRERGIIPSGGAVRILLRL